MRLKSIRQFISMTSMTLTCVDLTGILTVKSLTNFKWRTCHETHSCLVTLAQNMACYDHGSVCGISYPHAEHSLETAVNFILVNPHESLQ